MTRTLLFCVAVLLAFISARAAAAQSAMSPQEQAADAWVEMYFDARAQAAATTRDTEDDARVDRQLRLATRLARWRPAVESVLYRRLIARAAQRRDGEADALHALRLLAKAQPHHPLCSPQEMRPFFQSAYQSMNRNERTQIAEPYIEVLLIVAQAHERAWEIESALLAQREALSVARSARSPYREVLEDYGRALTDLSRATHRLDQLRARAQHDPELARVLAVRLAVERSDFVGAVEAARVCDDADFAQVLSLAAQPIDQLEPMQVLAVAEMFRAMADDPALEMDRAKLRALQEAHFYYYHFLTVYPLQDVVRLAALEQAEQLTPRLVALRPEPIRRPAGTWRNLVNGIAEPRTGTGGNLVRGQHLRVRNDTVYANVSAFTIPVELDESYDLRMAITLTHANDRNGMTLYFPIGASRGGQLTLGGGGEAGGVFQGLEPIERLDGFRFPEDRSVAMLLGVYPDAKGNVHLTLSLDGTDLFEWTGPIRALHVDDGERPPRSHGNIFRIGAGTTYEFQQIEVRRAAEE